jgi:hypothetical protein
MMPAGFSAHRSRSTNLGARLWINCRQLAIAEINWKVALRTQAVVILVGEGEVRSFPQFLSTFSCFLFALVSLMERSGDSY